MNDEKRDEAKNTTTLQLSDAYLADHSKAKVSISKEHYANLAWISIGQRDVSIDFFKAPGIIEDGTPILNGIRIYMPIAAAMRLSEVLNRLIAEAEKVGEIEGIRISES